MTRPVIEPRSLGSFLEHSIIVPMSLLYILESCIWATRIETEKLQSHVPKDLEFDLSPLEGDHSELAFQFRGRIRLVSAGWKTFLHIHERRLKLDY